MEANSQTDVLIVGGGTGGCAAAMAATSMGRRVVMTEATDWIGGQLTSQAVPPDEHTWIERFGCTGRYRQYRNLVRDYYRNKDSLTVQARSDPYLNPGYGFMRRACVMNRVWRWPYWSRCWPTHELPGCGQCPGCVESRSSRRHVRRRSSGCYPAQPGHRCQGDR